MCMSLRENDLPYVDVEETFDMRFQCPDDINPLKLSSCMWRKGDIPLSASMVTRFQLLNADIMFYLNVRVCSAIYVVM